MVINLLISILKSMDHWGNTKKKNNQQSNKKNYAEVANL